MSTAVRRRRATRTSLLVLAVCGALLQTTVVGTSPAGAARAHSATVTKSATMSATVTKAAVVEGVRATATATRSARRSATAKATAASRKRAVQVASSRALARARVQVLGHWDTEHEIFIPDVRRVMDGSLVKAECQAVTADTPVVTEEEAAALFKKVWGGGAQRGERGRARERGREK